MRSKSAIVIDLGWEQLPQLEFFLRLSGMTVRHLTDLDEALNRILVLQSTERGFSLIVVVGCHDKDERYLNLQAELQRQGVEAPLLVIDRHEAWSADDFEKVLSSIPLPAKSPE